MKNPRSTVGTVESVPLESLSPDQLRDEVYRKLIQLGLAGRSRFVAELELSMLRMGLSLRAYLIPIGIAGRAIDDLTANEIAHLVRFLRINIPQSMPAVMSALADN